MKTITNVWQHIIHWCLCRPHPLFFALRALLCVV
jgi:hypothetical protein